MSKNHHQRMQEVSYAHRGAPNGTRYVGDAAEAVPDWAVDLQPYDSSLMNWMGFPSHPTDSLLTGQENTAEMLKLRTAYDRVAAAGLLGDLETLQAAAKNKKSMDQAERAAGADM